MLPSPVVFARHLGELAIKLRIPSISPAKQLLEEGTLFSYGADSRDLDQRVTVYLDRILKNASRAGLAVERPTKFKLGLNMKTAKAIGLAIPPSRLLRVDQILQ